MQENVSYLDILQQAEKRGLHIISFTDHNTMRGYRDMMQEIDQLAWLEDKGRITPDEASRLGEYRRLFEKMLILPGFEFTAMFGFHILGIFSPHTDYRALEHLLLDLDVPPDLLDKGDTHMGATADVLKAYEAIAEAGGIVIAAHANSNNGVAMFGLQIGGQTRIAYTQDPNLHALEVTDLGSRGRRNTMRFFDGSKPEYPRRMRCIQGSDAHRLEVNPANPKNLGVGERVTEIQMPELSYEALYQVMTGNDFARTRPYMGRAATPYDHVTAARQAGASIVQDFHESMTKRGGKLYDIIADVCAFANTNGGTLYVGLSADKAVKPHGIENVAENLELLKDEIEDKINPPLAVEVDVLKTEGVDVIRVLVPAGDDPPYAIDDNKIYVRDENETNLAVRDEIVQLVLRSKSVAGMIPTTATMPATAAPEPPQAEPIQATAEVIKPSGEKVADASTVAPPRTGVEVVESEKRKDVTYHAVRDLRNGNIVRNVTRKSARKLWHYAIDKDERAGERTDIKWNRDIAVLDSYDRGGRVRYDLAQRNGDEVRIYYGVTEDGLGDPDQQAWRELLDLVDDDD